MKQFLKQLSQSLQRRLTMKLFASLIAGISLILLFSSWIAARAHDVIVFEVVDRDGNVQFIQASCILDDLASTEEATVFRDCGDISLELKPGGYGTGSFVTSGS